MTKVTSFDRATCSTTRAAVQAALDKVGQELGLAITTQGGSFMRDGSSFKFKVECVTGTAPSKAESKEKFFKANAKYYGITPEDWQQTFTIMGRDKATYKVVGLRPKRSKNCIEVQRVSDGRPFVMSAYMANEGLRGSKPKRTEQEIIEDLQDVESGLSPENLSCDGEASVTYINRRRSQLNTQRAALVAELGRQPTNRELYPDLHPGL